MLEGGEVDGVYYKIGVNGFVFMLINGRWIKSSKSITELREAIIKEGKQKPL